MTISPFCHGLLERLRFAAESRLRGARLYESTMSVPFLYVRVDAVGRAFHVALEYHKQVVDVASDEAYATRTWLWAAPEPGMSITSFQPSLVIWTSS